MFQRDKAYFDRHIADDAVFTSSGKQLTKRMVIAQIMEQAPMSGPVRSRFSNVSSRTTGDVVEVTATTTLSTQSGGGWRDFYEIRGTTRYKKIGGEWVMLEGSNEYEKPLK
jgi:ketosteroid isomerase-like protein